MLVAAFYQFLPFAPGELPALRQRLLTIGATGGVKGTVLLASEGINGTVSGPCEGVEALLTAVRSDPRLAAMEVKIVGAPAQAFHRLKVRIKDEIVTMGCPEVRPGEGVGTYVPPRQWDALIRDPATLVIDTRNRFEVALGSFEGAIDPGTGSFREFPGWVQQHLRPLVAERQPRALALFCTGGIRCEKATAYLLQQGFEGVHHLQGGILRYLEEEQQMESPWRGECFVFDQRVAVGPRLEPGTHGLCHACRMPLSLDDRALSSYVVGIGCRHCIDHHSTADRHRFAERERQVRLARLRGEDHIGRAFPPTLQLQGEDPSGGPDGPLRAEPGRWPSV